MPTDLRFAPAIINAEIVYLWVSNYNGIPIAIDFFKPSVLVVTQLNEIWFCIKYIFFKRALNILLF